MNKVQLTGRQKLFSSIFMAILAWNACGASAGDPNIGTSIDSDQIINLSNQPGGRRTGFGGRRPRMSGDRQGGHKQRPELTAQQKQIIDDCLAKQGIRAPSPGQGAPGQMPSESQRQAMHSCLSEAGVTPPSKAAPIQLSSPEKQQEFLACMKNQGFDRSNPTSNTAQTSVHSAIQTCKQQLGL